MLQINILLTSNDGCNKILVITIIQMEAQQRIEIEVVAGRVSLVIPCCNDGIADRSQHSGLESSKNRHNLNQSTICLFFDDSSPLC